MQVLDFVQERFTTQAQVIFRGHLWLTKKSEKRGFGDRVGGLAWDKPLPAAHWSLVARLVGSLRVLGDAPLWGKKRGRERHKHAPGRDSAKEGLHFQGFKGWEFKGGLAEHLIEYLLCADVPK